MSRLITYRAQRQNAAIDLIETLRTSATEGGHDFALVVEQRRDELHEANRLLVQLNRQTLAELASREEPHGHALWHQYWREAYPGVYDDPNAIHSFFELALARTDLDSDVSAELAEARARYIEEHILLSQRMIEILEPVAAWSLGVGFDRQGLIERRAALYRVVEQRRDLNRRSQWSLEALPPVGALEGMLAVSEEAERFHNP